ncbi:MAG: hypothetical protein JNM50_09085 [Chromatiales bacterium]|nr:hypothetical protein [Chromatiales bacterium]
MKTKGIALLSASALLAPAFATAATPAGNMAWTFLEAGYVPTIGTDDTDVDAGQITGSIGFLGMGHAQVEYTNGTVDGNDTTFDAGSSVDFDGYRLVVGAHNQLTENTQLIGDLTYFDYSYDGGEGSDTGDVDADGFGIGLGLRHNIGSRAEVSAEVWYLDGEIDADFGGKSDVNDTIFELRARYNWTQNLSTGITAFLGGSFFGNARAFSDDGLGSDNLLRADIRWAFGNSNFSDLK